jgi:oligoendopeptidase F
MTVQLPLRSEVAREHTWNAESVFTSREAWAAEAQAIAAEIPSWVSRFQGQLGDGPDVLADWLESADAALRRLGKLYVYAGMEQAVDTGDQRAGAMLGQAMGIFGQALAATAFAEPEILSIGRETVMSWVASEPRLAIYAHYFENLFRQQAHVRSAEVEEVLGQIADPFASVERTMEVLTNAEMPFPPATASDGSSRPVAQGTLDTLLNDPDREVRRTAWERYCDTYLAFKNTLASNLITYVKGVAATARIRRYDSALEMNLFPNNIPVEVFHNLIDTFRRHIPTWHRYWSVRRRALGVETLHHWDIWAPIARKQPHIPYAQAVAWIAEGMGPLGAEYVETLRRGCLHDRWVDIYPNQGKRQGAFSGGFQGTFPFIVMSYDDKIGSMSTLAHELGHSMHSYLTWEHQPAVYTQYSMFVAEVASNFNQAMVRAHMLRTNPDPDYQIAQIEEAMDNFHRYFFIMPTLARFEFEVHRRVAQGDPPTADEMCELMADLFSEGYGDELVVDRAREGITWAQFGHLYASFYVFQYATGISAAHALADRILSGEPGAAEDYLNFLKAGSSVYPLDALRRAGVDLTTPAAVEKTFGVLASMVDRLEQLIS